MGDVRCIQPLAFACGVLAVSCRTGTSDPIVVGPGDSLFRVLECVEVQALAASNVPDELRADVRDVFAVRSDTVPPERWVEAGEHPKEPGRRIWRARTRLRMDLGLGRAWLTYDGVACTSFNRFQRRLGPTPISGWKDPAGEIVIGWSPGSGELVAASAERPREVRFGWEVDEDRDAWTLEPMLLGAPPPRDARALARALTMEACTRLVVVVNTPSRLVARVEANDVDELRVAVAVWDVAFALRGGTVARTPSRSDGVTFRVHVDGELVWSRSVTAKNEFQEAVVELPASSGRIRELAFETDPGPGGDAAFDYGVWSGLSFHGDPPGPPARPHVVLVDVDTLRADRLGCYGSRRETSPRIDRWAAREAVLYEDVVAASNWTMPSTVSMLTGLAPSRHGAVWNQSTLAKELDTIAEILHAAGYETHARTDGAFLSASYGFARGFETFDSRVRPREELEARGWEAELARIRARRSARPQFWFLQTYMVHWPYPCDRRFEDPERPYQGRFVDEKPSRSLIAELGGLAAPDWRWINDTYDAGVRRMDDVVGAFLDGLADAFGADPFLVIVTSDHGEELGDHGSFGHRHALHEAVVRVPLLIRFPAGARGVRETRPASGLDLVPTILDVVGLPIPEGLPGSPLGRGLSGAGLRVAQHDDGGFAAYLDGWKLVTGTIEDDHRPLPRLVDLRADPREERDRSADVPERARVLRAELDAYLARHPPIGGGSVEAEPDDALIEELRALGYVE